MIIMLNIDKIYLYLLVKKERIVYNKMRKLDNKE